MGGADYRVEVHGSVAGNLVVGDHNLIVNATQGSSVTVLQEAERPKPVRRPSVRVLPRRPSAVLGRDSERGMIAAAVVGQSSLQVYGPPGIGKSTLLRQAAFDVADEAGGVIFLTAGGRSHLDVPQEIFEGCYDTSGYRPGPTELRRLLAGVRVCVLADDLVCAPDELLTILDAAPDAAFVLAAPDRELWGQGQTIELAGLSEQAALALVRREIGRDLGPAEIDAAMTEWRASGGSPMRLLRAAASMRPAAGATTSAPPVPAILPARDLAASLPGAERDVLALLGFIAPAGATVPVIAALAGTHDVAHVAAASETLFRAGLADRVDEARAGRDEDRPDAAAYQIADDQAVAAAERHYRRDTGALVTALLEWTRGEVTPADIARHGDLIVALIEAAVRDGHADLASRLARGTAPLAALSLRWGVWRDVLTSGQAAAKVCDDREAYAYFTHERGIRMLCLGQAAAAAAVLATAAGLWQALGLTQSAAAATGAQAIATNAAAGASAIPAQPPTPHPPTPQAPTPHPPTPQAPTPSAPAPHAPSGPGTGRRVVGRARVGSAPKLFPTLLVSAIAVVVVAVVVAAVLVFGHRGGGTAIAHVPDAPVSTAPTTTATPSPTVVLPPPVASSDNSLRGSDPNVVLDNDPTTIWSSALSRTPRTTDSWIWVDMRGIADWVGLSLTPREGGSGFPTAFRLESSDDGVTWTTIPGQDYNADHPYKLVDGPQTIMFAQPVRSRYVRLFATQLAPTTVVGAAAESAVFVLQLAEMHVLS